MAQLQYARALFYNLPPDGKGEEQVLPSDDTQTLRIASIFIVLAAGFIGGLPPLFLKVFRDPDSTTNRLARSFSAGVIATLALVHVIPEAISDMSSLGSKYPLGGVCVMGGVLLMVGLEHLTHIMHPASGGDKRGHRVTANGDNRNAVSCPNHAYAKSWSVVSEQVGWLLASPKHVQLVGTCSYLYVSFYTSG
ncbi:hypothetical protein Agub_g2986 [Astrephomene gubernaculifera]|uniref:Uncharacterized protein n=1 Tax=Astrephomene gubernaculifera TaxID=47775 RepID=A0AAD3HJ07_9CHLO|nr:hypothetical protein Agub_g2986 [Astrephomene gubernaculifera]